MDISLINSQSLFQLLTIVERKEALLSLVDEINAAIISTLTGGTVSVEIVEVSKPSAQVAIPSAPTAVKPAVAVKAPVKPAKKSKVGRAGGLKDRILALLDAAGPEGLRVKDISAKLGVKATNVSVWFSTTGKKLTTKIEPGRFASKGTMPAVVPVAPVKVEAPAKPAKAAKAAKKGKMTPEGKARIGAAAKARWAAARAAKTAPVTAADKPVASKPASPKPVAANKKGGISPEGRAKLAAAAKARWAKVRAGKASKP